MIFNPPISVDNQEQIVPDRQHVPLHGTGYITDTSWNYTDLFNLRGTKYYFALCISNVVLTVTLLLTLNLSSPAFYSVLPSSGLLAVR